MTTRHPLPPFTHAMALQKVQAAEDGWNSCNPQTVAQTYTKNSIWRNRDEFITGRDAIEQFLANKWQHELSYKLQKTLWSFTDNRIAVTFFYEWHNADNQWFRSYGNELWQFDSSGLMEHRIASINDSPIHEHQRQLR